MKQFAKKILSVLARSNLLFKLSSKIVFFHRNENNCDIESNGELNFIKNNRNNFSVIFDVGANVGEWTNLVSVEIPEAKVYSFEPAKKTYETLVKNIDRTNRNIILNNIGLGDKNETKKFYSYGVDSTLNSSIKRELAGTVATEEVHFETLDEFSLKNNIDRISFLKIDTEGNELPVLLGALKYIREGKIDAIQIEYGGTYIDAGYRLKDIFEFFKGTSYDLYKMMQNGLVRIEEYNQNFENFQYANYVAKLKSTK